MESQIEDGMALSELRPLFIDESNGIKRIIINGE